MKVQQFVIAAAVLVQVAMLFGCRAVSLESCMSKARVFEIRFQQDAIIVPPGETWRLAWHSPYDAHEIVPAYDVRITKGSVRLGNSGAIQTIIPEQEGGKNAPLDLWATDGEAVIWLSEGVKFEIASDRLEITVSAYTRSLPIAP